MAGAHGRMFDDVHLVWIGLASTAATFVCGARGAEHAALRVARAGGLAGGDDRGHGGAVRIRSRTRSRLDQFLSRCRRVPEQRRDRSATLAQPVIARGAGAPLVAMVTREGACRACRAARAPSDSLARSTRRRRALARPARAGASGGSRWPSTSCGSSRTRRSTGARHVEAVRPVATRTRETRATAVRGSPLGVQRSAHRISATAVATLFIASVARMMHAASASLSSSSTSNSSRRESGMPSFG